ncbi:MAG: LacI family DNA-binding transcriptional regulator [Acholeplasmataceae bacterium]|nr:LacI family DNA-binding transcriptional regulator [Acholeplasmataceae bacterium]
MADKRVLLKDIAERAGLTINTVSRALKDKSDISLATRQEVQRLALDMGYIPDVIASSLRNGYTKTIGIMFDNIANPYFMIMTELIYEELLRDGYDMMIFTSSGDRAQFDLSSFNKMVSRRIDGIITFLKPTQDVVHAVKTNKMPLVILGREGDDIGIDSVYTNDYHGGYQIGEHLVKQGHKKIGYIGAPKDILCSLKRLEGMAKFLEEAHHPLLDSWVKFLVHGNLDLEKPIQDLINQKVTAIFCFNDTMAYEAISILNQKGYDVPGQIAIVGYDNLEERIKVPVSLTTIDTNKKELTIRAIHMLMRRIENFNVPLMKLVNTSKLIVRKTA